MRVNEKLRVKKAIEGIIPANVIGLLYSSPETIIEIAKARLMTLRTRNTLCLRTSNSSNEMALSTGAGSFGKFPMLRKSDFIVIRFLVPHSRWKILDCGCRPEYVLSKRNRESE